MKIVRRTEYLVLLILITVNNLYSQELRHVQTRISDGIVEGVVSADGKVRTFKGIPYAAPPVDSLRWKPPQPPIPWQGVLKTVNYQKRAMQGYIWDDMIFRDDGPSEDCLYLNLWLPENYPQQRLPVMVWIHGGGFAAGSSSEPRQDGGNLCKKGVLVVSFNYRLGVFGFLALPELAKESVHNASGNYGLLDQVAALQWVRKNIAAFGGDPDNVTIFGESAGSSSVCALVASPLAKGLFKRAIGESGAFFNHFNPMRSRAEAETAGVAFTQGAFRTSSLAQLRALPAQQVLDAALKIPRKNFRADVDGYFLPEDCVSIYAAGRQSHVALLAGWNLDEGSYESYFGQDTPTVGNYAAHADTLFGTNAKTFLKLYPAATDSQTKRAAQDFMGDKSTGYSTWKWIETHLNTGGSPVYRYKFEQTLPLPAGAASGSEPRAAHAWEIEYVFRVLSSKNLPWRDEDHQVSELMSSYWTNFAKSGDPNGPGLPMWPAYTKDDYRIIHLKPKPEVTPDYDRGRYLFLDQVGFGKE